MLWNKNRSTRFFGTDDVISDFGDTDEIASRRNVELVIKHIYAAPREEYIVSVWYWHLVSRPLLWKCGGWICI